MTMVDYIGIRPSFEKLVAPQFLFKDLCEFFTYGKTGEHLETPTIYDIFSQV